MFMLKAAVVRMEKKIAELEEELAKAKNNVDYYGRERDRLLQEREFDKRLVVIAAREADLKTDEALNHLRKEMQKALVESDLKRVAAESRLAAYQEMDPKTERTAQAKLLEKAVAGLCDRRSPDIHIETAK